MKMLLRKAIECFFVQTSERETGGAEVTLATPGASGNELFREQRAEPFHHLAVPQLGKRVRGNVPDHEIEARGDCPIRGQSDRSFPRSRF
jgi:hypothetical protein